MKKNLLLIFLGITLFGCKSYVQVFETKANNISVIDDTYVYENDSLKITYNLWRERGLMKFEIFNKLNVPLYIDWRKSSYIDNDVKLNYWEDVERTSSLYASYYFYNSLYRSRGSLSASNSTMVKEERITFIPPKSKYSRSQFYILPWSFTVLNKNSSFLEKPLYEGTKKTTKVYYKEFDKNSTPRVFRNFLSFSLTEDFTNEFYVDNEFYISRILEMDQKSFYYYPRYTRLAGDELPYKDHRYFYINLVKSKDLRNRGKNVRKVDFDN